jgi:hypothetical protein
MDNKKKILEFNVPISQTVDTKNEFLIKGIAINETTTRNGITYVAKELRPAAPSFRNKPVLKDHENKIDNIVGRTTDNVFYNEDMNAITFEANIKDKEIISKIKEGLITNVSIGAGVQNIVEEVTDGVKKYIACGIEGYELSLVAVPGDGGATFDRAMLEMFESLQTENKNIIIQEDKMSDIIVQEIKKEDFEKLSEEVKTLQETLSEKDKIIAEKEQAEEKIRSEKMEKEQIDFLLAEMKKNSEDVLKKVDEKITSLKVEEKKEETKGEVKIAKEESNIDLGEGIFLGKDTESTSKGLCIYAEKVDSSKYKRMGR